MNSDSIQDSTRYLVKDTHYGSIMPGKRSEMLRNVYLQSGACVKGGIFANELAVSGDRIKVEGAVYCKSNIQFDYSGTTKLDDVTFSSTVVCPGTILIPATGGKVRFLSDIYSGKINLKNCIVYGNIYATSAHLEDCIVLGGIYCKNDIKLKNTVTFTFRANKCQLEDHVSLLSPFGFAEQIILESTVNVLMFNNLFNKNGKIKHSGNLKLDETDIYEVELERKENEDDKVVKKIRVLSVAERLLNTSEIIEHFKQNKNFIEFLSLNSHLSEEDKQSFVANNKEELEKELWQIIEEKSEFEELEGTKSIEEMFAIYNDNQ